ncbi:sensor histidine kinase [Pseudonocardia sp. GCM10023141]|uniref:sensor histidine kinase n=1 Tax=Pseudonocardia sp. GCM10023141 TaxID=3252653 RepID=UPI003610BB0B
MPTDVRVRDLGYAAAYLLGSVFLLMVVPVARITWWQAEPSPALWVELAQIGVACVGATQRRSHPLVGLGLTTAAMAWGIVITGGTGTGVLLMFTDLLYCAVLHTSRRVSWAVSGAAGVVIVALGVVGLIAKGPSDAVQILLSITALLGIPVLWGREVRRHQEQAGVERDRADQTRRVAELDRLAAVTAERASMARDLHDVIAGQLSAIAIQSEAVLSLPDPDPATLRRVLTSVRTTSVASLNEMRTMIGLLREDDAAADEPRTAPAGLDSLGTLLETARATGLTITLDDRRPPAAAVPAAVDLAAYRIVQESLTNAAKHAPGSAVGLTLRNDAGMLVVEIDNDLVPDAAPAGGTGTGLLGLRERASAVGGRVVAEQHGTRWSVRASLPVPS